MIIFGQHSMKLVLDEPQKYQVKQVAVFNKCSQADYFLAKAKKFKLKTKFFSDQSHFLEFFYDCGGKKGDVHQNAFLVIEKFPYLDLQTLLNNIEKKSQATLLLLDGITDPQNFGSILRSAAFYGVSGIIIPERRSVAVNSTVLKVSAGGFHTVPVVQVKNIARVMKQLKSTGFWLYAMSEHADQSIAKVDFAEKIAFVMGNEESGVRQETIKNADMILKLTGRGELNSLNAAVATAITLSFSDNARQ